MPPSYFYHLGFELYPYPEPRTSTAENNNSSEKDEREAEGKVVGEKTKRERERERQIWLPPQGTDIFDSRKWPKHSAFKEARDWSTECLAESSYGVGEGGCEDLGDRGDCGGEDNISAAEEREGSKEKQERKAVTGLSTVARDQNIAITDWRYNAVSVEGVDMEPAEQRPGRPTRGESSAGKEIQSTGSSESAAENLGRVTQARFVPVDRKNTEVGWGIVHLYRDEEETPGLADLPLAGDGDGAFGMGGDGEGSWGSVVEGKRGWVDEKEKEREREEEEDCTTLCVLAVPSFFTASDFLSWVGHKTREQVSHFRMVMTGRVNRFLVLMKFRDGVVARKWRAEWDGKLFVAHERETCHVMFIKSITFQTATSSRPNTSFPEISHDPFTPSNSASNILQPLSPTTTSLVELPTCPVCLERMDDDTSGLLTTPCQHVFHCDCLQKWRGTGCPVCRHTNASLVAAQFPNSAFTFDTTAAPFGSGEASLCNVCDCADDLWICLTCGKTGCGRYKGGHAKEHWKDTAHNFALEIETQHVWDYAEDVWVHRLLREKGDSKIIELPSRRGLGSDRNEDMVPREKLESIGMEYTHLLTSQLESQRIYFEDQVSRAVAKATAASQAAASATSRADAALKSLSELQLSHTHLLTETLPNLEKELAREKKKAEKSAEVARNMSKSLMEEKKVSEGLMERIGHVNAGMMGLSQELTRVKEENRELGEANRDLLFSITGGERLREMNAVEGGVVEGEVEGGTVSLPPAAEKGGRKKGKGKK